MIKRELVFFVLFVLFPARVLTLTVRVVQDFMPCHSRTYNIFIFATRNPRPTSYTRTRIYIRVFNDFVFRFCAWTRSKITTEHHEELLAKGILTIRGKKRKWLQYDSAEEMTWSGRGNLPNTRGIGKICAVGNFFFLFFARRNI